MLGGRPRRQRVRGPLGDPVDAEWYELDAWTAAVEMALASGLELVGGADRNDPVRADTAGTGELVAAAVKAGARHVLIGMGGSATTDGGWGALEALEPHSRLAGVEIVVGCDVRTRFLDRGGRLFSAKGGVRRAGHAPHPAARAAGPGLPGTLRRRRQRARGFGCGRRPGRRAGGARGHAGPGFELVAERIDLAERHRGSRPGDHR